jgi:hypothetical protein
MTTRSSRNSGQLEGGLSFCTSFGCGNDGVRGGKERKNMFLALHAVPTKRVFQTLEAEEMKREDAG